MIALTAAQKAVLRFLHASPAVFTPVLSRGVACSEAHSTFRRRVWLSPAVYDRLIARGLTVVNDEREYAPNYADPQVARLLGVPLQEAAR